MDTLPAFRPVRLWTVLALALLGPAAAQACSPGSPDRVPVDRPITLYSDGSFVDASDDDGWDDLSGHAVRDIGGGRVGQVIEWRACYASEGLLFVDCTTGSALLVRGIDPTVIPEEKRDVNVVDSVRALQPPYGPLALAPATTVAEVAALAAREGWTVETDVLAVAAEYGPQNRFDPFMGCRIFYPGSVGATR